jgi:hypothetical protein
MNYQHKRKRRSEAKGIGKIFNKIIAEKFPNLEKDDHPGTRGLWF